MSAPPRVVLATFGSAGDLNPFLAIALRLKEAGLDPLIVSQPGYRDKVASAGIAFRGLRADLDEAARRLGIDLNRLMRSAMDSRGGARFIIRDLVMPGLREAYEDLHAATEGAALVVVHGLAFAARLAAEKRGLPWLGVALQPIVFFSPWDPPVLAPIPWIHPLQRRLPPGANRLLHALLRRATRSWFAPLAVLRSELGLPAEEAHPLFEGQFSPHGNLALYSPLLGTLPPDAPKRTALTGMVSYDRDPLESDGESAGLDAFLDAGPPPLVFALGSSAVRTAGNFFRVSRRAASGLGMRAVFVIGDDPRNAFRSPLGPDMHVCRYARYSRLFPRALLIVHQGGVGTAQQALRAGRPQLVVPFAHDQPDNARRIVELGVGGTLSRGAYRLRRVALKILELLADPRRQVICARVAAQIAAEDGAAAAVARIRSVLGRPAAGAPGRG